MSHKRRKAAAKTENGAVEEGFEVIPLSAIPSRPLERKPYRMKPKPLRQAMPSLLTPDEERKVELAGALIASVVRHL